MIAAGFDVIIIGAGAAGLMCAMTAGRRGRRVLVLEHTAQAGAKILISGGGRCNFTNMATAPGCFISANPHFCKSALSRYTPRDFVALVQRHNIPYHEKTLGQLFCDGSARAILAMLLAECQAGGADLRLSHHVSDVTHDGHFRVETDRGAFTAPSLVLATGGLSIPKLGATGFALDVARRFGLRIAAARPGLVPLTFQGALLEMMQPLAGVGFTCEAAIAGRKFREAALFTHKGLSGPAILQISSYWHDGPVMVNLLPGRDAQAALLDAKTRRPKSELASILAEFLPYRLAQGLAAAAPPGRIADMPDRALRDFSGRLSGWSITPSGTEGYAKAEVMAGGVDTRDLSSRTMAARAVPGLYVIGEAVDVTGWLGGYNFQWAWSSGWCAGMEL